MSNCGNCGERIQPCRCGGTECPQFCHLHGSHWCSDSYHKAKGPEGER